MDVELLSVLRSRFLRAAVAHRWLAGTSGEENVENVRELAGTSKLRADLAPNDSPRLEAGSVANSNESIETECVAEAEPGALGARVLARTPPACGGESAGRSLPPSPPREVAAAPSAEQRVSEGTDAELKDRDVPDDTVQQPDTGTCETQVLSGCCSPVAASESDDDARSADEDDDFLFTPRPRVPRTRGTTNHIIASAHRKRITIDSESDDDEEDSPVGGDSLSSAPLAGTSEPPGAPTAPASAAAAAAAAATPRRRLFRGAGSQAGSRVRSVVVLSSDEDSDNEDNAELGSRDSDGCAAFPRSDCGQARKERARSSSEVQRGLSESARAFTDNAARSICSSHSLYDSSDESDSDAESSGVLIGGADWLLSPRTPQKRSTLTHTPSASTRRAFAKQRDELAEALFAEYDGAVPVSWSTRLNKTAGLTYCAKRNGKRTARIELATKVVDEEAKLRNTLCHEMCHAAAWLVDGALKPPHGKVFRKWAAQASKMYADLDITTCHNYDIHYKHRWQCTNTTCLHIYGRHSKSIDVERQLCGKCRSRLSYLGTFRPDGTPAKARKPSGFSLHVKDRYASVRAENPGAEHADIMGILSMEFRSMKVADRTAP